MKNYQIVIKNIPNKIVAFLLVIINNNNTTMKIDIVYTWVNGEDKDWKNKKIAKLKSLGNVLPDSINDARFKDNNELLYSLRSISMFAPWVNKIFIVTDNQQPKWLNTDHPKIEIIDHKDIFYDNSLLPTFSARGIESQLHHIPNLSEHFIYFNDDMFLGNDCQPDYFFNSDGLPYIFVSEIISIPNKKAFDISKRDERVRNDHQHAIVNSRKLFRQKFGKSIYFNIRHGAKPLLKSVLIEVENIFKEKLIQTAKNSFRTNEDVLMIHLAEYYLLYKNLGKSKYLRTVSKKSNSLDIFSLVKSKFTFGYINLHDSNVNDSLGFIEQNRPFMICLNQTPKTPPENVEKLEHSLKKYFNMKSDFEL